MGTDTDPEGGRSGSDDSLEEERRRRRTKSRSKSRSRRRRHDEGDAAVAVARDDEKAKRSTGSKKKRSQDRSDEESSSSSSLEEERRKKERRQKNRKRKKSRKEREHSKKKKRTGRERERQRSPSSADPSTSSDDSDSDNQRGSNNEDEKGDTNTGNGTAKMVVNEKLLAKLSARGETLEERKARRAEQRAALIKAKLGYTAEENPFNDPNLTETFTWKKRDLKMGKGADTKYTGSGVTSTKTLNEIEKVRKRRKDREEQFEEMERIRAEESRMKELENYDDWARKEEEFHLHQQRHRSAIRLVEGREKPIDVLAKNILMFGLSDEEKKTRDSVKYQERYNAMDAIEALEAELEEPQTLLKMLKLNELEELMVDIDAFRRLEREASAFGPGAASLSSSEAMETSNTVLRYWDNLRVVAADEIKYLKSGGDKGRHAKMVKDVTTIFEGQCVADMIKMKGEIDIKLRAQKHAYDDSSQFRASDVGEEFDREYWLFVQEQLLVHLAKADLSDMHSKMLVRQLERLEKKKEDLAKNPAATETDANAAGEDAAAYARDEARNPALPENVPPEFGDLEEELGLSGEIELQSKNYSWQEKYRPRKPRYFNRVKTGYDWNKYNQTHYDHDNPPPKIVQGYKFNIFYPDLIDPTKTPQFFLEPADTEEFCIIRFRAGPPYEDIAFKIINREWNRSRKRGFKSTFERGVLSLYFNFTSHWYRK